MPGIPTHPNAPAMAQLPAAGSYRRLSLEQLQHRFNRLRQLQSQIKIPAADYFEACGQRYQLPLSAVKASCSLPRHTLEYLTGFFDGDGCVTASGSDAVLAITQSSTKPEVLLFYRNTLGGGIYTSHGAKGLSKSRLVWRAHGARAQIAAEILGSVPSCKREQLLLVGNWPSNHVMRIRAAAQLSALKQVPPSAAGCPSWAYLAGFF